MCATAISFARLRRLYFGASDEKAAASSMVPAFSAAHLPSRAEIYGGLSERLASQMLKDFFAARRG